jgi:hypothetical protein
MDNLRRIGNYFRSPLVACGTLQTACPHPYLHGVDDVPDSFYKLFGRPWGHTGALKRILNADAFILESATEAFDVTVHAGAVESEHAVELTKQKLFHMLGLPGVEGWSEVSAAMLAEGKSVVPLILDPDTPLDPNGISRSHGYHLTGSAEGDGFTCSVYRKQPANSNVPIYVIAGEMDISADEFHALVCDVSFRHNWDDQFHHATAAEVDKNVLLVEWVVKWPWPLAPREYQYLLAPHRLDDGTNLVVAASRPSDKKIHPSSVPVREYFGITGAKSIGPSRCRYCVFYYDDPSLPGRMPAWLEQYVTKQLLPSFPQKVLVGASMYPKDRFGHYSRLSVP